MKKIRVLVVDDSSSVRQVLKEVLESDPGIEVIGTASDPFVAAERIAKEVPDVITLDVEMPRMDGITFLERLMKQHPIPVVMCSSLTTEGSASAIAALEKGAVGIIEKPRVGTRQHLEESRIHICDVVRSAAQARLHKMRASAPPPMGTSPKLSADVIMPKPTSQSMIETTDKVIVVGASTGGTEAIRVFLQGMPEDSPGIVIVQHMPEKFTACFAARLDGLCRMSVREAQDNDSVLRGLVLIAPGNKHMLLKRSGARYYVEVRDGPLVNRHRPSVDVLFRSAARYGGRNTVGVILTGMGDDGAQGMKEMKTAGATTIAQDEATCVVYGMPNEAVKAGGVDRSMPLENIAPEVTRLCR
ncbi:MAG: chemotaxis response regulator protein-glutamate methylesterase [Verrucomicrobiota bacterium]|nr:chemotaxis response regulator protein-glutamate methylesterase [Verrucomicrobiota bacterium]